ncbi:hypothetical protein D5S17_09670 [Pseudonocardiaceae bacterium YIM PH 21723]|nr:hypothetical protein D5S17_09670 [Pseudonocardiaceae bacterium YIM PH 21723]
MAPYPGGASAIPRQELRPRHPRQRVNQAWNAWRGRAVEPVIRESLLRLLPNEQWPETECLGGWWNRQNNPEIDLVGTDREPVAKAVHFVGSIKWRDDKPFDTTDYAQLVRDVVAVPGAHADTPLVAVSNMGFTENLPLATAWGPEDLISAWRR